MTVPAPSEAVTHLEQLAAIPQDRRWNAHVADSDRHAAVRASNPAASAMTDQVSRRSPGAAWRFPLKWVSPVEFADEAAKRISRVLRWQ